MPFGTAIQRVAATASGGYTLVNGTGTILSWTAPNDGNLHHVMVVAVNVVSSTETGGEIAVGVTDPAGNAVTIELQAPGLSAGSRFIGISQACPNVFLIEANTTFTLQQFTALTGGAAVLYAELWAW